MDVNKQQFSLAAIVSLHLIVTLAHGWAHSAAAVPLGWASLAFVVVVIQAAPLIGLAWMRTNPQSGAQFIGIAMAASLLFGLINHFVISSPDHVNHVAAQWRPLFTSTAIALVVTEAAGAILGLSARTRAQRKVRRRPA
jgi:hypothetical protein